MRGWGHGRSVWCLVVVRIIVAGISGVSGWEKYVVWLIRIIVAARTSPGEPHASRPTSPELAVDPSTSAMGSICRLVGKLAKSACFRDRIAKMCEYTKYNTYASSGLVEQSEQSNLPRQGSAQAR